MIVDFNDQIFDMNNSWHEEMSEIFKEDLIPYLEKTYNYKHTAEEVCRWKNFLKGYDKAMVFKKVSRGTQKIVTVFYNEKDFIILYNKTGYRGAVGEKFYINSNFDILNNNEDINEIYFNKVDMTDETTMINGLVDFFNIIKRNNIVAAYKPNCRYKYHAWQKSTIAKTLASIISKDNYVETLEFMSDK